MADKEVPQLPGYYYDKEKNRYFKLVPGQEHANPLTGEHLQMPASLPNLSVLSGIPCGSILNKNIARQKKLKNICSMISMQQVSLHPFKNSILSSILNQTLEKNNVGALRTSAFYEYDVDVDRFLPSGNKDKILLQSRNLILTQVDNVDIDDNALTMAIRYHFPYDKGSTFTDFSFASEPNSEEAIIATIVPPLGGSSFVLWGPDYERSFHRKCRKEFVAVCKWHKDYLVYGVDSNFVLVHDINCHFIAPVSSNSGAALVKTNSSKMNFVTAFECTELVIYAGHRNGKIFGYDRRTLSKNSVGIHPGTESRNVCDMHLLPDEYHLVSRHGSTVDCTYLWDLRFLQKPILNFGAYQNTKNIGFQSMSKYCFFDFPSDVMSCYHIDGMLRLWNVKNGEKLAETDELNGGVYSEKWSINQNKPGIIGLNGGKIVWLPLKSEIF